jgi:predicted small lipoprotein YifL
MKPLIALIILATLGAGCAYRGPVAGPQSDHYTVRVKEHGRPARYIRVRERTDRNGTIRGRTSERGKAKYYTVR